VLSGLLDLDWRYGGCGTATLTGDATINLLNVPNGASGTFLIRQDSSLLRTFSITATGYTVIVIGSINAIQQVGDSYNTVTYKRFGSIITVVYGHDY